jgi:hypothetical protein
MTVAEGLYSITEVSKAFATPVSTLRYYDDIGLVPASCRRSRIRHYDHPALRRLSSSTCGGRTVRSASGTPPPS